MSQILTRPVRPCKTGICDECKKEIPIRNGEFAGHYTNRKLEILCQGSNRKVA